MNQIAKLISELEEIYPNRPKLSDGALAAYIEDLSAFTVDQVKYAIREHRKISKWFPSIAELIDLASGYVYSDNKKESREAWLALTAARKVAMDSFYAGNTPDLKQLAKRFERAGRMDGAAHLRKLATA